jgi:hypothetical protein
MSENRGLGLGRPLIALYAVFALSATARATYQLVREFDEAPIAYSLSLVSALTYVAVTILLTKPTLRKSSRFMVWFELLGVVSVGTLSLVLPELFNHPSVWSGFGIGYGFIPLVLPILGILWLSRRAK